MATEELRRIDPSVMVLHRPGARFLVRISQSSLAVTHDEKVLDVVICTALVEGREVLLVVGLVLEEGVDVLDGPDAIHLARDPGKIEIGHLSTLQRSVQRPLGQGDIKQFHRIPPDQATGPPTRS